MAWRFDFEDDRLTAEAIVRTIREGYHELDYRISVRTPRRQTFHERRPFDSDQAATQHFNTVMGNLGIGVDRIRWQRVA